MVTFTIPGIGRKFEAVELRRSGDSTHPVVSAQTAEEVVAALGRKRAWFGRNLAVQASGIAGEVFEVLRPDESGNYDLWSIEWYGQLPGSHAQSDKQKRVPDSVKKARARA